ncbi:unnamed protein product [Sphagnum jensenii]|uniref:PHD-type domain-containing protein n=1 Tax=Sphagnum jensenii TaxID=128206 RepID=A0ABP1BCB8_9BRYO
METPQLLHMCYLDVEYVDNLLLQCDKCHIIVHMNCYGVLEPPDGKLWLCSLCGGDAPKQQPLSCLCPITSGAMKRTTDGRWAHLTCALWMPELSMVDNKRMEPVDGINAIHKEHWNLTCCVYRVYYMDLAYDIQTVTAVWHIIPCVLELLASIWKP